MERISLMKVGGVCAILTGVLAAVGFIMIVTGTDLLDTEDAVEILPVLDKDQNLIATGLFVLAPVLAIGAALGLFQALRGAGDLMWIAVVAFVIGLLFVIVNSLIGLGIIYELAPDYVDASGAARLSLEVTADTLATIGVLADLVSSALTFGIGVLLFSLAILRTSVAPKWVGWLGVLVALLGGWLALIGPASEVFEIIGFIGFIGFWVWMIVMGGFLWRTQEPAT